MVDYKRTKLGCYVSNIAMAAVSSLSPLLFIAFRELYGFSYTLLGLLVLVNFVTQLTIDIVFSLFSHKFNIPKTVKFTPVLAVIGFVLYAGLPILFPNIAYVGLLLGTIVFSASSGLCEVLLSPVVAAIPAENPEREMSKLHSIYAWGVVGVIVFGTLYQLVFHTENWFYLAFLFALIPLCSAILFAGAEIPPMQTPEKTSGALAFFKDKSLWLCVIAIFLGGASECTMSQWSSGYLERAVGLPKVWGDIFGVAAFGVTLGLGRTLYAKIGKNVEKVLFFGAIGATACYALAVFVNIPLVGLFACAFTGFCVSMLWPGSLIVASEKFPQGGVFIYAMMAAGGDLGASVGPQLVGVVTDGVIASSSASSLASSLALTVEELGMRVGMLVGTAFPLLAILVFAILWKSTKHKQ